MILAGIPSPTGAFNLRGALAAAVWRPWNWTFGTALAVHCGAPGRRILLQQGLTLGIRIVKR